jgi:hypothetical protein
MFLSLRSGTCNSSVCDSNTQREKVRKWYVIVKKSDAGKGRGKKKLICRIPMPGVNRSQRVPELGGRGLCVYTACIYAQNADR